MHLYLLRKVLFFASPPSPVTDSFVFLLFFADVDIETVDGGDDHSVWEEELGWFREASLLPHLFVAAVHVYSQVNIK